MLNRNTTRHLLLVVSILLCAFIYAGYTLTRGSGDAPVEATRPAAQTELPGGLLRPDSGAAAASRVPAGNGDDLALSPPAGSAARPLSPPPAILPAPPGTGAITGLVPEAAGNGAAGSGTGGGTALPLPGFAGAAEDGEDAPPPVPAPPGMEYGNGGMEDGFAYDETGEAPDGDFAALPGFDDGGDSAAPPTLTPPETETARTPPPAIGAAAPARGNALAPPPAETPGLPAPALRHDEYKHPDYDLRKAERE